MITALALDPAEVDVLQNGLRETPGDAAASFTPEELADDIARAVYKDEIRVTLSAPDGGQGVGQIVSPLNDSEVENPPKRHAPSLTPIGLSLVVKKFPFPARINTNTSASPKS